MTKEEKRVILASSLGTVFEWYDFYLYGSLAVMIGAQFFSAFDPATRNVFALLAAFEWISASFALGHLLGEGTGTAYLCGVWNLAGVLWLMPYTTPLTLLQVGITTLALLVATSVQFFPLGDLLLPLLPLAAVLAD
jgi:hypothetical protein